MEKEKIQNLNETVIVEHLDGSTSEVTPELARSIMKLHNKLSESNRTRILDMLEASSKHFQTIAKFSKE